MVGAIDVSLVIDSLQSLPIARRFADACCEDTNSLACPQNSLVCAHGTTVAQFKCSGSARQAFVTEHIVRWFMVTFCGIAVRGKE